MPLPTLIRFGSLDELIATIKADIATADKVLETSLSKFLITVSILLII